MNRLMPWRPKLSRKPSSRHRTERSRQYQHLYSTRWNAESKLYRECNPYCVLCGLTGHYRPVQCVDHILPHKGSKTLFWNPDNWQSLCNPCHRVKTRIEDNGRYYWWQPDESKIVLSGPPGVGKTTAALHMAPNKIWDMDKAAEAMGWPEYPRPKHILNRLIESRRQFIESIADIDEPAALIISNHEQAFDVAQSLRGRHLPVTRP